MTDSKEEDGQASAEVTKEELDRAVKIYRDWEFSVDYNYGYAAQDRELEDVLKKLLLGAKA